MLDETESGGFLSVQKSDKNMFQKKEEEHT